MNEERDQLGEELLRAVGGAELADVGSPIWRDQRFLSWLRSRAASADELAAEQELASRIRASANGVRVVRERPRLSYGRQAELKTERSPKRAPRLDQSVAAGIGRELWEEVAEEWIELPDDVAGGEFVALRITGDSMTPVIHAGDTVLVRRGGAVQPRTVVVARDPANGYVCKRVRSVSRRRIRLESLAPDYEPIDIPNEASLVLGTVIMVWCEHGR